MSVEYYDHEMRVEPRGFNRSKELKEGWTEGDVVTPFGIVSVYAQGDDIHSHITRLDFVFNGRLHLRTYRKRYTVRGIKTKAYEFAKEVAGR